MASKAPTKASKAPSKDRDLAKDQLLYAMLLQVGLPSGPEAWSEISARIPGCVDGAARHRWARLRVTWDDMPLFGDKHDEIIEAAENALGQPRKVRGKYRGKGKGKAVETKERGTDDEDEADVEKESADKDDGGEGSSRPAGVRKPKKKVVKKPKKVAPIIQDDSGSQDEV